MGVQRTVKPKTQRGKRFLRGREPKVFENTKTAMFIKGGNTSHVITSLLKEFHQLKRADAIMYKRKNILRPFEDETPIEFFSEKSDASLFMFGSHSKKRPNNLVLGRLFDHHILDMVELGVEKFTSMYDIPGAKCTTGTKPCLMFVGEMFDSESDYMRLKNMFIDFFRGTVIDQVRLQGLEQVILFAAGPNGISLRVYRIELKKSGTKVPRVELVNIGPNVDFSLRRTKLASDDLFKRSLRVPKEAKIKSRKNVSHDAFGSKLGRIHMQKQNLDNLQTRKVKALKRKSDVDTADNKDDSPKKKKSDGQKAQSDGQTDE